MRENGVGFAGGSGDGEAWRIWDMFGDSIFRS